MKTDRTWVTLSVCLLGVAVLAGWLLARSHPNPSSAGSVPVAEAKAPSTSPREPKNSVRVQPVQEEAAVGQATEDLEELAISGSPDNSQDLDKNREWARSFPSEALAWLQNAPDGEQRIAMAEIVCSQLAQTDAEAAVALAEMCLGDGTNNVAQNLLANLTQQWAGQDLAAASDWALAKPEGEQRDGLLQRIAFVQAENDPSEAAQLIVMQMSPGELQNEAAITVLHQWARQDAATALAWAESFPPGELRTRAIDEVMNLSAYAEAQALDE